MNKLFLISIIFSLFAAFSACDKNPVNRIVNPSPANISNVRSGTWVIYDDEIKTGGDLMLYNTGAIIDFKCTDNPHSGKDCIRYSWDGKPVYTYDLGTTQSGFSGFSLICAPKQAQYSTYSLDLSTAGYTKITFWARGSLNSYVKLRVTANSTDPSQSKLASGATGVWEDTVTSSWVKYSLDIDNMTNNLAAAKDFVKINLVYAPGDDGPSQGNGGTVYLDDIELTK